MFRRNILAIYGDVKYTGWNIKEYKMKLQKYQNQSTDYKITIIKLSLKYINCTVSDFHRAFSIHCLLTN